MFSFFIGWGVFWLLLWLGVFALGMGGEHDGMIGTGILLSFISAIYLISVLIGYFVA